MGFLYYATFVINFLGLVLALWLGLYLITRNPRYLIAWLAAISLLSLDGLFLNVLLAINPPLPIYNHAWLRFMFPFWPAAALLGNPNNWLLGWSVAPSVACWYHVTVLMRPGGLNAWRWARILFGYLMALLAILAQANGSILYTVQESNPLYLNSLRAGTWYPVFGIALLLLTSGSVINLVRSAHATPLPLPRKQLLLLATASLVTGLVAPVSMAGSMLGWPVPMLTLSFVMFAIVGIIGYGVARYSAVAAGRTVQRDFVYSLVAITLVTMVYLLASLILVDIYRAPRMIAVFVPVLAVVTHSLLSTAYRFMDWLFYRGETRRIRSNLRHLIRLAGEEESLEASLKRLLEALCTSVLAANGLIMVFEEQAVRRVADFKWKGGTITLDPACLAADDFIHLKPGQLPAPLDEAALLVPLYGDSKQLGVLLLGRPVNGIHYRDDEVERLMSLADRIGDVIYFARRKSHYIHQIAQLAKAQQPVPPDEHPVLISVECVETALRNLYDYSFLGDTSLGELKLVRTRLVAGEKTTLDRGRTVHNVLLEAVNKLRPRTEVQRDPPPREWYPYLIMRDAYLEERSNRDIMLQLYISEGTFNRTRRAAVRSIARTLGEMEAALEGQGTPAVDLL